MPQIVITQQATNGTAVPASGGYALYTPNAGYTGSDEFKYHIVSDTGNISNEATVSLTVTEEGVIYAPCDTIPGTFYEDQSDSLILAQFCGSTNLIKLFRTKSHHWDRINDILAFIHKGTSIETASCFMLDVIGNLVGQDRVIDGAVRLPFFGFDDQTFTTGFSQAPFYDKLSGTLTSSRLNDDQYRIAIKARIAENNGSVSLTGVENMLQLLYQTDQVYVKNKGNAKVQAVINTTMDIAEQQLIKALGNDIVGAAIGFELIVIDASKTFGFSDQLPPYAGFNSGWFVDDLLIQDF